MTPDAALKQAEQFLLEENWLSAIEVLQAALQNKRNRTDNVLIERVMVSISSIEMTLHLKL